MPTPMEDDDDSKKPSSAAKPNIEVKQLQRYYTVLRDFMAHFHSKPEIYPPNHEFTQDELSAVTPKDIIKWMNVKLYNKEDPGVDDRPLNGSHHTLDYYKKSISYFMPKKEMSWDPVGGTGNPSRSTEVNNLIKRVKEFDEMIGGSKKRKSLAAKVPTIPMMSTTAAAAKKARASLPAGFAPMAATHQPVVTSTDGLMHGILLRRMHAQNASFIDLFGTLSQTLEMFKTTLQANNLAIMNEISSMNQISAATPAAATARMHSGFSSGVAGVRDEAAAPGVGTGMLDWQYVHPDGVRRRVPPTWSFPHSNLQEMYILWHCGDYQNRISPMKLFDNSDVNFLGKRARMNLNEVKNLMSTIDEEACRKGKPPAPTMTLAEASECFQAGLSGFDFSATTPTGKQRNILRLKWSTLTKYNKTTPKKDNKDEAEDSDVAEKAKQEFITPSVNNAMPEDDWWYEHDDGMKRRVPSTFSFPMLGLEDMYIFWHCGNVEQKISPMKLFQYSDVSFLKRAKTNLSEVRAVMTIVDLEAAKLGNTIKSVMTVDEAKECCEAGYKGLNIPTATPDGRNRDILRMKWSSAVRLKNPTGEKEEENSTGEKEEENSTGEKEEENIKEEEDPEELPEAEVDV